MKKIKLGDKVKDKLTELEGIAIAKTIYLNGCVQFSVQPRELKDGKPIDDIWIDEAQLENVKKNKIKKLKPLHGGIRNHPR